jgi:hypothetical protein
MAGATTGYLCHVDTNDPSGLHEQLGSAAVSPSDSTDFAARVADTTEAVLTRVSTDMSGEPYHLVLAELSRQLEAAMITMPETWLRTAADDIAAGRRPHR